MIHLTEIEKFTVTVVRDTFVNIPTPDRDWELTRFKIPKGTDLKVVLKANKVIPGSLISIFEYNDVNISLSGDIRQKSDYLDSRIN